MEALGINTYLFVQIISFIVIYLFLRAFAFAPITKSLTERRERIARGEENARLAQEQLANAEADAQKLLDEKRVEAQQIVSEATRRALSIGKKRKTSVLPLIHTRVAQNLSPPKISVSPLFSMVYENRQLVPNLGVL